MLSAPILSPFPKNVASVVRAFPTNSSELLPQYSYFNYVLHYLGQIESGKFLEIGYRKGIFAEVCKTLKVPSVHLDITDKLLRASPTKNNVCLVVDSLEYLKSTSEVFRLVFQDGSKSFHYRWTEYKLIQERGLLDKEPSYIVSDDLHYSGCLRAFNKAISELRYEGIIIDVQGSKGKKRSKHKIGVLKQLT